MNISDLYQNVTCTTNFKKYPRDTTALFISVLSLNVHTLSGKETLKILSQNHLRTYSKGLRIKQSHLSITHPAHKSVPETQDKQNPSVHF